jgi:membrane-bound serine protease (ClpP class)
MKLLLIFVSLSLLQSFAFSEEPNGQPDSEPKQVKSAVIICKGLIDNGLYKSIERRTQMALDEGVEYLIYEIGTYGGLLKSGDDISKYFILEVGKKAHTVAYITTEAISAGAMISVSCKDIIMLENTTIGDCAPIQIGGKLEGVEREKTESFTRAAFKRAAEANHYPTILLEAMVTMQLEVYKIKNLKTGKYEFFDAEKLPKDPNKYDMENKELVVKDDQLLTLTAIEALGYGIARAKVQDLDQVIGFLSERDNVNIATPIVLETNWSEEMVRWINSPAVMGILVLLALLGVYMELNTPGVGLPGLVAVICFVIIVSSKHLIGLANWLEVAIFVVGVLLLLIEIFVLPGFGIAGALGIIFIIAGLFGMLVKNAPDELPWPQTAFDWQIFTDGILGVAIGVGGFVFLAWLLAKYMPKMEFLSGLILRPATAKTGREFEVSMTAPIESENMGLRIGDIGRTVTTLRPAGRAEFGSAIVDVVAEAEFIEADTKVQISEIHGNRVIVKDVKE